MTPAPIQAYDADDALVDVVRRQGIPGWRVYRPSRTQVVLGRGSKVDLEIDLEACGADGVPVFRRRGGGCSVVLDPGNVIVSVVLPVGGIGDNKRFLHGISDWVAAALRRVTDVPIERSGISDLAVDGRKISGSCIHRARETLYYSTSILVEGDLAAVARYLQHPPREPAYRQGRDHQAFLTNLGQLPGRPMVGSADIERHLDMELASERSLKLFNNACLSTPRLYHYRG